MTLACSEPDRKTSYVVFPMGTKRFALRSDSVIEFARPDRLYTFPHTTPRLLGVLVRRGRIVPVCDLSRVLTGKDLERKFYLITRRKLDTRVELTAIPVTGECELVSAEEQLCSGKAPGYVTGLLASPSPSVSDEQTIQVLDLEQLLRAGSAEVQA